MNKYLAVAAASVATTIFFGVATYADATVINVSDVASYYGALETIHNTANGEFTINLTDDVTINNSADVHNQAIDNGNTVTILGNNHTLTFALDGNEKIMVDGATLNLGKSDGSDKLIISGGGPSVQCFYSLVRTYNSATLNMYNGVELTNNHAVSGILTGGGVRVGTDSTFNMYGGKIHHNSIADGGMGGAVAADYPGGEFHMYDGELSYNSLIGYWGSAAVAQNGGLVHIHKGTIVNNTVTSGYGSALATYDEYPSATPSTMIIENATIKDNDNTNAYYGAILNFSGGGTITIKNSIIENNTSIYGAALVNDADNKVISQNNIYRNNTASYYGGAIYTDGDLTSTNDQIYNNTALQGGGAVITGGTTDASTTAVYNNHASTAANDYYIGGGATSVSIIPAANMNGYATYGTDETTLDNWYNDTSSNRFDVNDPTAVVDPSGISSGTSYNLTAAGRVVYTLHFETDGGSAIDDQKVIVNTEPTEPTDPTKDGYTLEGWFTDTTYETAFDFTAPLTAHATAYAKWAAAPAPAPTPDPEPLPDNPPTGDKIATYIYILSVSTFGFAAAQFIRKK